MQILYIFIEKNISRILSFKKTDLAYFNVKQINKLM